MSKGISAAVMTCLAGAAPAWAQPANDNCGDAQPVGVGDSVTFETSSATNDGTGSCGSSDGAPDIWYRFTAPSGGIATFSLCGSSYDTVIGVFDGCGGSELACVDDACDLASSTSLVVSRPARPCWSESPASAATQGPAS